MQAAMGRDPVKVMIDHIKFLVGMANTEEPDATGEGAVDDKERRVAALEEITMYCEDLDLANG